MANSASHVAGHSGNRQNVNWLEPAYGDQQYLQSLRLHTMLHPFKLMDRIYQMMF